MAEILVYTEQEFKKLGITTRENQSFDLTSDGLVARRVLVYPSDQLGAFEKSEITLPANSTLSVDVNLLSTFTRINYVLNFKDSPLTVSKSLKVQVQNNGGSVTDSVSERLGGPVDVLVAVTDDSIDQFLDLTNNESFALTVTFLKQRI